MKEYLIEYLSNVLENGGWMSNVLKIMIYLEWLIHMAM